MNTAFLSAVSEADKIRMNQGFDMYQPINVFDICAKLGVTVRFHDINMEGVYISQENGQRPTIILSTLRPLPRRQFTCAHELGHHVFKHGSKVDGLIDESGTSDDAEELLVNSFAGSLLMPVAGVRAELATRSLNAGKASPLDFYILSSVFGTGYQTLISHCKFNKLITVAREKELLKLTPSKILKKLLGTDITNSHFKILDSFAELSVTDLEVSNYIILPRDVIVEGNHLKKFKETTVGTAYIAVKPGIVRVVGSESPLACFVRIQNINYIGLAENRHLENLD